MILQRPTDLSYRPQRIISLVPSQTELLFDLGLESETLGITKFCVHPQSWFKTKERIGGTKTVNIARIKALNPDLVIANKEENVKEQVEELAQNCPVWLTDVNNLEDALQMIDDIGTLTGKKNTAAGIILSIRKNFSVLKPLATAYKTAYLIWQNPFMTVGVDTFIQDMLLRCGFDNIFHHESRYPETSISHLQAANCRLLLLSSEPYPFTQKHVDELSRQLPATKILLVDGEYFSWYGSRLLKAPAYFNRLLNNIRELN